ncbi:hypothetical protein E4U58_005685 [Claviceps cyperi]|nr:hypothetical protein E4U58_005685 [Claviceps cyperi]
MPIITAARIVPSDSALYRTVSALSTLSIIFTPFTIAIVIPDAHLQFWSSSHHLSPTPRNDAIRNNLGDQPFAQVYTSEAMEYWPARTTETLKWSSFASSQET